MKLTFWVDGDKRNRTKGRKKPHSSQGNIDRPEFRLSRNVLQFYPAKIEWGRAHTHYFIAEVMGLRKL